MDVPSHSNVYIRWSRPAEAAGGAAPVEPLEEAELLSIFGRHGSITSMRIVPGGEGGAAAHAFIRFEHPSQVRGALTGRAGCVEGLGGGRGSARRPTSPPAQPPSVATGRLTPWGHLPRTRPPPQHRTGPCWGRPAGRRGGQSGSSCRLRRSHGSPLHGRRRRLPATVGGSPAPHGAPARCWALEPTCCGVRCSASSGHERHRYSDQRPNRQVPYRGVRPLAPCVLKLGITGIQQPASTACRHH